MIPFMPWWKLAAVAALLVVLAGAAWKLRHGGLVAGRAEVQAEWNAAALVASENARLREQAAQKSNERVDREYQTAKTRLAADKRATDDSLRDFQAAIKPDNPTSTSIGAHGTGGLERELLGSCATHFAELGITADRLEAKVVGLQSYINNVCLAK